MSSNLRDEYVYLDVLCTAINNVKTLRDQYATSLVDANPHKRRQSKSQHRKDVVDYMVSSFLLSSQEERRFLSLREDLENLNFLVLRNNNGFKKLYDEKIKNAVGMSLDIIPDDFLKSIFTDITKKYAHRDFSLVKDFLAGIKDLSKSYTVLEDSPEWLKNLKTKEIINRIISLHEKSVNINLLYVYENEKVRKLDENSELIPKATIQLDILDTSHLCDEIIEAYKANTEDSCQEQIDLFESNYFKEFSNFSGTTIKEGLDFFVEHFDKISRGTTFAKFTKERKQSFFDIVEGMLETEEVLKSHDPPEDVEKSQTESVLNRVFACVDKACHGLLFRGDGASSSSANYVNFVDAAYQGAVDPQKNEKYIRSGGFDPMYIELLLTCVETMIQILQYEKNPNWFKELSKQGVVKEILDDLNEKEKKFTCSMLLANMRNSIVHGKYIVLPSQSQEFGVEFYDGERLSKKEKFQGKKPKDESKFILGVSDLEDLLTQGHAFLKSVADPEGQDLNDNVEATNFFKFERNKL